MAQLAVGVIVLLTLVSCASAGLDPEIQKIKIMKGDPPSECQEVGVVDSQGWGVWSEESRRTRLKVKAAEKGGNYVRLDKVLFDDGYVGTAYKCPTK